MSDEVMGGLSEILGEALAEEDTDKSGASSDVTLAQRVSATDQTRIIDERVEWLAGELDVPRATVQLAQSLRDQYRKERGDLRGTSLELVAAACLYCAVRVTEEPLAPSDFEEVGEPIVTQKSLVRRSKDIAHTVGLDASAFLMSRHYVERYCKELGVSEAVLARAKEILEITEEIADGKSPTGWAGAAVYNACLDVGEKRSQSAIADVADISPVTIRKRYSEQRNALREATTLPAAPEGILDRVATTLRMSTTQQELAEELIKAARDAGHPVDEASTLWALAALRRAGAITGDEPHLRSLSQYTAADSSRIKSRRRSLREVVDQSFEADYRGIHDESTTVDEGD